MFTAIQTRLNSTEIAPKMQRSLTIFGLVLERFGFNLIMFKEWLRDREDFGIRGLADTADTADTGISS